MAKKWGYKYPFKGGYYTANAIYEYYKTKNIPVTKKMVDLIIEQEGEIDEATIIKFAKESIIKRRWLSKDGKTEEACIEEFGKEAWDEICHNRKDVYLFKGKYYSTVEIWCYYEKRGISISKEYLRQYIKEKKAKGELIDENEIIEIVKRCIIKVKHLKSYMEKAIMEEFGEEVLNEILEARKQKIATQYKTAVYIDKDNEKKTRIKTVYPFKERKCTLKEIWMYYVKCGISITESIFKEEIKEKETMGELIDEEKIIEIVKKCIVRTKCINASMKEAIIEEFGEEVLNEVLKTKNIKGNKSCKKFRDTMKSDATVSAETRNIDSDNGISLGIPSETEK